MDLSRSSQNHKLRILYIIPCFTLFTVFIALLSSGRQEKDFVGDGNHKQGRHMLEVTEIVPKCVPPSIDSFPEDFFTQEQRVNGGVVVHFLILAYLCAMLAVVCDDYFVPSLDIISNKLQLPSDVAGATFMAIGTSSPELFSSIIGSFITKGDIGIGTIVGSAVFNILGCTGLAGIVLWDKEVELDWYPVTRDASVYVVTIAALTIIISNNVVTWWEALIMLVMFLMYILLMYFNSAVEKISVGFMEKMRGSCSKGSCCCCGDSSEETDGEKSPLLRNNAPYYTPELIESSKSNLGTATLRSDSYAVDFNQKGDIKTVSKVPSDDPLEERTGEEENDSDGGSICSPPRGTCRAIWWLLMWPASLLFFLTVPNCKNERCKKFYVITFASATLWLGALSYLCVWMVTIIGYTLAIPDTVSGLTLLAVGTSLPEILSSVIVVRNGLGNMVMSNLIGSNIFDILFCLGLPWLIRGLTSGTGSLIINSSALTYTTSTLLTTVVILLFVFYFTNWKLNRAMGLICLLIYAIFLTLACMYELNVFGEFNPPPC